MLFERLIFISCQVRSKTSLPFVMDESVNDVESLLRLWKHSGADVVNIKISKFGGLTKAKQVNKLLSRNILTRICILIRLASENQMPESKPNTLLGELLRNETASFI